MASNRNFYDVLGVSKTATAAEIKSAYRKMALQFHPDRNKEKDAESKFKEINEAYEVLSDEKKRQTYDQYGHAAFTQGNMGSAQGNPYAGGFGQQGPFSYSYTGRGGQNPFDGYDFGGFSDPFDIFESFFGGGFSRQARKPLYELEIDFMDAVNGATKEVAIDGKKRTIKIPPGADTGTRIRYQEFDVRVLVRAHAQFKREADDIHVDLPVPFYRAILGGEISVPTLDGSLTLKLRPGTQPNSMIRLREYGVTHLSGRGKGDQYVRIVITMPEKLSKEERKALEVFES